MKKVIYIYTDGTPSHYKIGKAERDRKEASDVALERIREQLVASFKGTIDILAIIDVTFSGLSSLEIEGLVHKELLKFYDRISRTITYQGETLFDSNNTEWFLIPDKEDFEVIDLVQNIIKGITGHSAKTPYIPRFYQEHLSAELLLEVAEAIDKNKEEIKIGLEFCPRFGKTTFGLFEVFKPLFDAGESKILLLPAFVLSAHSSFAKEIKTFQEAEDFVYLRENDPGRDDLIRDNYGKRPIVLEISLHKDGEDIDNKLDFLDVLGIPKSERVFILDEADFGAHTERSRRVTDKLNSRIQIFMTGTNIDRALKMVNPDILKQFTYEDLLLIQMGQHELQIDLK